MMPLTTELGHFYNGEGLWRHPPVCCRFLMVFLFLVFILRTCSFRSSCQFLKTRCPSVFDPSSTRWTPGYPAPARWAAADRHESTSVTSHHTSWWFSMWGWLTSLLLPACRFPLMLPLCHVTFIVHLSCHRGGKAKTLGVKWWCTLQSWRESGHYSCPQVILEHG